MDLPHLSLGRSKKTLSRRSRMRLGWSRCPTRPTPRLATDAGGPVNYTVSCLIILENWPTYQCLFAITHLFVFLCMSTISKSIFIVLNWCKNIDSAVVVALLVERSLLIPEVCGSNQWQNILFLIILHYLQWTFLPTGMSISLPYGSIWLLMSLTKRSFLIYFFTTLSVLT